MTDKRKMVKTLDRRGLTEISLRMAKIVGNKLEAMILYGFYARGTQTDESDVDIALILREKLDKITMDQLQDFLTDMDIKYGKLFSVVNIDTNHFETYQDALPFYRNIRVEGVVLWENAMNDI